MQAQWTTLSGWNGEDAEQMTTSGLTSKAVLGFLTIVKDCDQALYGGYLVLNLLGRPMEFHCTTPIKPNRAQEILYGPTLEPYLFGEQIGRTLLSKSQLKPVAVCTDREPALAVREYVDLPVALVLGPGAHTESDASVDALAATDGTQWRLDPPHDQAPGLVTFRLGRNHLGVSVLSGQDQALITERLGDLPESFDLAEPFGRIREAIEEARRGGQQP
jgi:hypothetical protein